MKRNIPINHRGYSLVEMCVVIIVMAITLSAVVPNLLKDIYARYGEAVAMDMAVIEGAARAYYIDNRAWPADIAALKENKYLSPTWSGQNPLGKDYIITSTPDMLTVQSDVKKTQVAPYASRKLPQGEADGSVVKSSIAVPGGAGNLNSYDSGWFSASANVTYTKSHNLGTTKVLSILYFSDTSDGSGRVNYAVCTHFDAANAERGTNIVALTNTDVSVRANGYLAVTFDRNGSVNPYSNGYLRIVMAAL
ncbi:MAG: type II secretion system protein [Candidatus Omnitrophica bacterium]|nr:type II secretion system protein [Candidatus Omnitrophota bacterium]